MWKPIIPALESCYQVNCITPSWVRESNDDRSLENIEGYLESYANLVDDAPVSLIAWSMGGLIAIRLAEKFPGLVDQIIFIASAPQFLADENFKYGIGKEWFDNFVESFKKQPQETLKKFIALQAQGDENAISTARFLKTHSDFNNYHFYECLFGLNLLGEEQLSNKFESLQCKSAFIHGDKDAVLSYEAAKNIAIQANSDFYIIENAGHVPHVSHPEETIRIIKSILR